MPGSKSWRQRWLEGWDFTREVYLRFTEDRIALAAGAISFFTLLSLIPLLLLGVTFAAPVLDSLLLDLHDALGPALYTILQDQISFVQQLRSLSTIFAIIFGFWSGSQVFLILESAMNLAWHAQKKRPFWLRRLIAFLMVVIVGSLLILSFFLANAIRFVEGWDITILGRQAGDLSWLVRVLLSAVIPILVISSLFAIIYRILPTRQVTLRTVIPGALSSGILWLVSLHVFGWYTASIASSRYKVLYGSLAGIILLMLWFYYSAFIMLLGAEISATYHRRLVEAGDKKERQLEEHEREQPATTAEQEQRLTRSRLANAADALVYYGYRSEE